MERDKQNTTTIPDKSNNEKEHSKIGTAWVSLIVFVILLLLLAIFILQNSNKIKISYFGFHGNLSFGVGMFLAALAGSILTLLVGSARIIQLKSRRKKSITQE
jgi:uncharacterized integral membrane protein